jgi:hypothetical protein
MFRRAEDLHAFLGEICVEPRKRESGSIDGRFSDLSMKPYARAFEFHQQIFGVPVVKALDSDNWNTFLLNA